MSSFKIDINDFSNGQIDNTNPQDPKWEGTGIFDIIIKAANENIKIQHKTSRITGAEYAEVYLGTMQSAISEAMKFLLAKEITEKEILLKDSQIIGSGYDNQVKAQQVLESTYKVEELLPAELLQLQKQTDIAERGMVEQELTGAKQREILYVERVIKDKEAATLGMDKVVRVANTSATTEAVYKPKYEEA